MEGNNRNVVVVVLVVVEGNNRNVVVVRKQWKCGGGGEGKNIDKNEEVE